MLCWISINSEHTHPSHRRIIDGQLALIGQFPYHVDITLYFNKESHQCGGGLISSHYLLTAGHCLVGVKYAECTFDNNQTQRVDPDNFIMHGFYHEQNSLQSIEWDAAMLKLEQGMSNVQGVSFLKLPNANTDYVGKVAKVAGHGYYKEGEQVYSDLMRYFEPIILSKDKCEASWPLLNLQSYQICAKDSLSAACKGDSGGSLVVTNAKGEAVIVGVLSFGSESCSAGTAQVYTKVSELEEWIKIHNHEIN